MCFARHNIRRDFTKQKRYVQDFSQVVGRLCQNRLVLFGAVAHFHNAHTGAPAWQRWRTRTVRMRKRIYVTETKFAQHTRSSGGHAELPAILLEAAGRVQHYNSTRGPVSNVGPQIEISRRETRGAFESQHRKTYRAAGRLFFCHLRVQGISNSNLEASSDLRIEFEISSCRRGST